MRAASTAERERLNETFAALCRIPSVSGDEDACAAHVTEALESMGLTVERDTRGNLLARIRGRRDAYVLLCAHLDTVALTADVDPVVVDDGWENANEGILGADNKAAVAVLLEVARRCSVEGAPIGIELLFTLSEEVGLQGAAEFDVSTSKAAFGFVFDHATAIGEVITAAPTLFEIRADFRGKAAHAGICPEEGRSAIIAAARALAAMPHGRLDTETTVNAGGITGGSGSNNVVAERCRVDIEARSVTAARVEDVVAQIVDALHDGANAVDCDVDITCFKHFEGYRHRPSSPAIAAGEAALRACGYEPRRVVSGGGSDANAFEVNGLHCVNLANGTERAHEPTERVAVAALEGMLDVVLALVDEAAERIPAASPASREAAAGDARDPDGPDDGEDDDRLRARDDTADASEDEDDPPGLRDAATDAPDDDDRPGPRDVPGDDDDDDTTDAPDENDDGDAAEPQESPVPGVGGGDEPHR